MNNKKKTNNEETSNKQNMDINKTIEKDNITEKKQKKELKRLNSVLESLNNKKKSKSNTPNTSEDIPKKEEQVFIIGKVKKSYLKESEILRALELNAGVISDTAKMLRTSYTRLKEFIDSNESLKQAAEDVSEIKKDLAESKLNEHIRNGNLTAIIFFLKTKAKDRGYVESMDLNLPNKPIYFVYKEVSPESIKK